MFLSVARKAFNIVIIATIMPMSTAINIIALLPLPTQTIIIGPNAILGKLLSTTTYGSNTFLNLSDHQSSSAIRYPKHTEIAKPKSVSYRVIPM